MAAKKKLTVPGRKPPPIDVSDPELAPLARALAEEEASGVPLTHTLEAEPEIAIRLLAVMPRDLGEVPEQVDWSLAKTRKEHKELDASHVELTQARMAREASFATLYRLAARDLDFQQCAWRELDALPKGSPLFRDMVAFALLQGELAPEVEADVVKLATTRAVSVATGTRSASSFASDARASSSRRCSRARALPTSSSTPS